VGELLTARSWQPSDIHAVIVSHGPGSYTGLRVGIMSAKTFAYATGCALLAVETFAAIASQSPLDVLCVDVVADAQQEKIYVQRFVRIGPAAWLSQSPLTIQRLAAWLEQRGENACVTGPGLYTYRTCIPYGIPVANPDEWDPQPENLLRLGLARYRAGERDSIWALEPLYQRPSSAEDKWQERSRS
jgi:tRNA threonylcarbamoyladenosine biosynthesis protein TsaB